MNYESRPPRRGLLPNMSSEILANIARIEYAVFTKASCALAWKVFSRIELWPKFCSLYKHARWQGAPWVPGSRLKLEIGAPVNVTADRVVTVCSPPHHLAWINHVAGYTMEQWISLDPSNLGGTRVSSWIELTGGEASRDRTQDVQLLRTVVVEWFDNFCHECDRTVETLDRGDIPAAAD